MPQQQQQPYQQNVPEVFGVRVDSGNNHSATNGVSSVKLHAPPGGRSNIQLF